MTLEEYQRLVAAGVIDKVEFLDGEVRMGEHRLAFSASQVQAAADIGIDLLQRGLAAPGDVAYTPRGSRTLARRPGWTLGQEEQPECAAIVRFVSRQDR